MEVNDIKHGEDILELLLQPSSYVDFNRIHEVLHISRRTFFYAWQITSLIRTSPESFNGSLLMMYF